VNDREEPWAAAVGFQGAGGSLHNPTATRGLGWLKIGCAVLPAPDWEWLNSACMCQAPGQLGAADGAGRTREVRRSPDLPPGCIQADDGAHLDVEGQGGEHPDGEGKVLVAP
jgi:hypothetical protein